MGLVTGLPVGQRPAGSMRIAGKYKVEFNQPFSKSRIAKEVQGGKTAAGDSQRAGKMHKSLHISATFLGYFAQNWRKRRKNRAFPRGFLVKVLQYTFF